MVEKRRGQQMRGAQKPIAILAGLVLVGGVVARFEAQAHVVATSYEMDVTHARSHFHPAFSSQQPFELHVALLSFRPASEAILDAVRFPLVEGKPFEVDMGFRTPQESAHVHGRFDSFRSSSEDWRAKIPQSRPLPEAFGGMELHLALEGAYLGRNEGLHTLKLDQFHGHGYRFSPGGSGGL